MLENKMSFWHTRGSATMFDWSIDPRSQLAILCLVTAFVFWNNDLLFFMFCIMAVFSRIWGAIQ